MTSRQNKLLKTIVDEYIKTAQPVGSELIAEKYRLNSSPATIRNEMVTLTDLGFLSQPHISAGRVPTQKAYRYYIENFLGGEINQRDKAVLKNIKTKKTEENLMKQLSKQIAELAGQLSILALDKNNFYYTGFSYLFSQPEFSHPSLVYNVSQIVDRLDNILAKIFNEVGEETEILIGEDNPFGEFCGTILSRYRLSGQRSGLFGLLGPIRMDYNRNVGIIDYVKELLTYL